MRRKILPKMTLCLFLFLFLSIQLSESSEEDRAKCRSAEGTSSCGQCIKQHPDCAWCSDPRLNGTRCDLKVLFPADACQPNYLFSPATEIKVAPQHNLPLGGKRADSVTPIQLEPQQVEIRMKPGDVVEVPFRYLHKVPSSGYEVRDFTIQTSEFRSLGLDIEFSVDCDGERKSGRLCPGVKSDQKISFYAKISLNDCSKTELIAVSVGIYGYNTVSAIFVTPLCGCDCENPRFQERRSPRCGYQGNLVCGVCQCNPGKGGERCECDLNRFGVSSPDDLLNQCREHKRAPVCSGKGTCSCGKCSCEADYIRGKFCECDNANCPMNVEGRMCSGRGECECEKCVCERGFAGEDCACSDDPAPCTQNGVTCSNNGYCECSKCSCNVGWTGATCQIAQSLPEEPPEYTTTQRSSESIEEDEEAGDGKGDVLPSSSQSQIKSGEDGGDSSDSSPALQKSVWIIGLSSALTLFLGLFVL